MATDEHLTEKLIKYLNVINKTLKINQIYDFLLNFIEQKLISWIAEKPQNIMPNDKMKLIRVLHGKTRQTNRCLRYVIVFFCRFYSTHRLFRTLYNSFSFISSSIKLPNHVNVQKHDVIGFVFFSSSAGVFCLIFFAFFILLYLKVFNRPYYWMISGTQLMYRK